MSADPDYTSGSYFDRLQVQLELNVVSQYKGIMGNTAQNASIREARMPRCEWLDPLGTVVASRSEETPYSEREKPLHPLERRPFTRASEDPSIERAKTFCPSVQRPFARACRTPLLKRGSGGSRGLAPEQCEDLKSSKRKGLGS